MQTGEILNYIIVLITTLGGWKLIETIINHFKNKKKDNSETDKSVFVNQFEIFQVSLTFLKGEVTDLLGKVTGFKAEISDLQDEVKLLRRDRDRLIDTTCYNKECPYRSRVYGGDKGVPNMVSSKHITEKIQE